MGIADRRTEYETAGLDRGDLLDDPIGQWRRWYDDAVGAGVEEPNAMALATVDSQGRPHCRFVLVRGADANGFTFFTNLQSPKAEHLRTSPSAAVTFGWLQLHRQVRVRGHVEPVTDDEADAYFASRPLGSRLGAWASPQSAVLSDRAELDRLVADVAARFGASEDVPRPPFWGGFRVVPEELEFWQGRPSRLHDRFRYRRADDRWIIERLAP